jgi:hypothetical protein
MIVCKYALKVNRFFSRDNGTGRAAWAEGGVEGLEGSKDAVLPEAGDAGALP